jgi:hypothetical protein
LATEVTAAPQLEDFKAFDKIMKRKGGKTPREGDEMPA